MTVKETGSPDRREEGTPRRMPRSSERGGSHTTYFGLHRTLVRGPGGKYTQIECPICGRLTVGAEWTVVGVIGTEEIT